jgi:hypothetical protein
MMLRAHFDGKVIIPDDPIDLPANSELEIEVRAASQVEKPKRTPIKKFKMKNGIPLARNDGIPMTSEEVAAALYD